MHQLVSLVIKKHEFFDGLANGCRKMDCFASLAMTVSPLSSRRRTPGPNHGDSGCAKNFSNSVFREAIGRFAGLRSLV
jgi:hypothetical protein